jgi:L-ascorbate metabolism protein UlaG (beta-lactamase superfamily)
MPTEPELPPRGDRLTYVGHATTLLRLGGASVLTDPMLRGWLGPLRRQAPPPRRDLDPDLVLISHLHLDHLDLGSLRRVASGARLVVPRGAGEIVSEVGAAEIIEMAPGESRAVGELTIGAISAVHDGSRGPWARATVEPLGYVIEGAARRVYFAGDTELFAGMAELAPLDLALLPVWGWGPRLGPGHLDPAEAARALALLRPRVAVPIHWGTFYPLGLRAFAPRFLSEPPLEFERLAAELAPEVQVRVVPPGSTIPLVEVEAGGGPAPSAALGVDAAPERAGRR